MKIKHIESDLANKIRSLALSGTTDSKSTKHLVFHIDEKRDYALMRYPGSTYYCRGANYVNGYVRLIWISNPKESYVSVFDIEKRPGGMLTESKADQLVEEINQIVDSLSSMKEFIEECKRKPEREINQARTVIGIVYYLNDKAALKSDVAYTKYVKEIDRRILSTSPEHEEELKEKRKADLQDQTRTRAIELLEAIENSSRQGQIEIMCRLIKGECR